MFALVLFLALVASTSHTLAFHVPRRISSKVSLFPTRVIMSAEMDDSDTSQELLLSTEMRYDGVTISGFTSKASNIAEPFVYSKLFMTTKWNVITAVTDDILFTRKRFTTPETVYSGLIDKLQYANNLTEALKKNEAWIAFNVSSSSLSAMAKSAIDNNVKRAVFAVPCLKEESGVDVTFADTCAILRKGGVDYTIIKFGVNQATRMGEAKFPYRISRGELALPHGGDILSSDDLMRIISEVVDLPKTFNKVYSVGAGSDVDREILSYMKSQGWPERVQIGLLCGDFMEKAEAAYEKERETLANSPKKMIKKKIVGNKFAGFETI